MQSKIELQITVKNQPIQAEIFIQSQSVDALNDTSQKIIWVALPASNANPNQPVLASVLQKDSLLSLNDHNIVQVSLPGITDNQEVDWTTQDYALYFDTLAKALKIQSIEKLIGFGLGAQIALTWAAANNNLFKMVVVYGAKGVANKWSKQILQNQLEIIEGYHRGDELVKRQLNLLFSDPSKAVQPNSWNVLNKKQLVRSLQLLKDFDLKEGYSSYAEVLYKIESPVLLICSETDQLSTLEDQNLLIDYLPDVDLKVFSEAPSVFTSKLGMAKIQVALKEFEASLKYKNAWEYLLSA